VPNVQADIFMPNKKEIPMFSEPAKAKFVRRHDLDWLRVFAVVVLLLFHSARPFDEWGWHIKNEIVSGFITNILQFINIWHMPLFFLLSGSAAWFAMFLRPERSFAKERVKRLFIPLVFGMAVIIPPQVYIERIFRSQFEGSYFSFYLEAFNGSYPKGNLSWHHLWFLAYLFVFSLLALPVFKRYLVDRKPAMQLVRYIHRNPLEAGLVKRLDRYAWSSHKGYISTAKKWSWLYKEFVLQMLAEQVSSQIRIYRQFMAQQQDKDLIRVFERKRKPSMLGSNEFISWVKDRFFKKKIDKEIPASKGLAPDTERIISEVSRHYEANSGELTEVRRGLENEPRDVAIYLIRSMRSDPLMRIGARFGLTQYSSVSSVVMRVKTKLRKDKKFKERLAYIENKILKGQS
jgi:hypothetical protein